MRARTARGCPLAERAHVHGWAVKAKREKAKREQEKRCAVDIFVSASDPWFSSQRSGSWQRPQRGRNESRMIPSQHFQTRKVQGIRRRPPITNECLQSPPSSTRRAPLRSGPRSSHPGNEGVPGQGAEGGGRGGGGEPESKAEAPPEEPDGGDGDAERRRRRWRHLRCPRRNQARPRRRPLARR